MGLRDSKMGLGMSFTSSSNAIAIICTSNLWMTTFNSDSIDSILWVWLAIWQQLTTQWHNAPQSSVVALTESESEPSCKAYSGWCKGDGKQAVERKNWSGSCEASITTSNNKHFFLWEEIKWKEISVAMSSLHVLISQCRWCSSHLNMWPMAIVKIMLNCQIAVLAVNCQLSNFVEWKVGFQPQCSPFPQHEPPGTLQNI